MICVEKCRLTKVSQSFTRPSINICVRVDCDKTPVTRVEEAQFKIVYHSPEQIAG